MQKENTCHQGDAIKSNKHKCNTNAHILQKQINKLNNMKINDVNINQLVHKVKKSRKMRNPLILIISPSTNTNILSSIQNRSDIVNVSYTTHKDINIGVSNQLKFKFNTNIHDGLVVKLICIVSTYGEKKSVQFYYDLRQEARHINKLRNTIKYALPHKRIILDSGLCPVFKHNGKNCKNRSVHTKRHSKVSTINIKIAKDSVKDNKQNNINSDGSEHLVEEKNVNDSTEQKENKLDSSIVKCLQEMTSENVDIDVIIHCFRRNNIDYKWFQQYKRRDLAELLKQSGISRGVSNKIWNVLNNNNTMKLKHDEVENVQMQLRHLQQQVRHLQEQNKTLRQENSDLRRIVDDAMSGSDADSSDHDNDDIQKMQEALFVLWVLYLFMKFQIIEANIYIMLQIINSK